MNTVDLINTLRARAVAVTDKLAFLAPALIRVTVGLVFIRTGWGKLNTLPDVTEFFASLHIPLPALNARIASGTEFFGGILILVGLGSRLVALPMAFVMVIAILTAQREKIDDVITLVGFEEWSYLIMFLVIALQGPGVLSLDALLARKLGGKKAAPAET